MLINSFNLPISDPNSSLEILKFSSRRNPIFVENSIIFGFLFFYFSFLFRYLTYNSKLMECQATKKADQCNVCKVRFSREEKYVRHRALHSAGKNIFIETKRRRKCNHLLLSKCTRLNLLKLKFPCSMCEKEFEGKVTVPFHCLTIKRPYRCTACGRTFRDIERLRQHILSRVNSKIHHSEWGRSGMNINRMFIVNFYVRKDNRAGKISSLRQEFNDSWKRKINESTDEEYYQSTRHIQNGSSETDQMKQFSKAPNEKTLLGSNVLHEIATELYEDNSSDYMKLQKTTAHTDTHLFNGEKELLTLEKVSLKCQFCHKVFKRLCGLKTHLKYCHIQRQKQFKNDDVSHINFRYVHSSLQP